jgi:hypothetical protein
MPLVRFFRSVLALVAVVGLAGCVSAGQPGGGRVQLVSDLANRLERAGSLTYTATYRLPGGSEATISQAQDPTRSAYRYPGGTLILTPTSTADCRTAGSSTTCTLTAPPAAGTDPAGTLVSGVAAQGLIAPVMVVALLTATAMDGDAVVTTHDTTLAGQSATCVQIGGVNNAAASDFDVCVTVDGVLASFDGVIESEPINISLDRYEQTVAPDAFDLPAGATVVDNRPR